MTDELTKKLLEMGFSKKRARFVKGKVECFISDGMVYEVLPPEPSDKKNKPIKSRLYVPIHGDPEADAKAEAKAAKAEAKAADAPAG